jgi:nicotinamidase-related amidase
MSKNIYKRLIKENCACLMVDHQVGLFSLVKDFDSVEFKNNVLATSALSKYFKLPTILTTSMEEGPNGPLLPEIVKMHPGAPIIKRPGQINAFDNEEFVEAVKKTGKQQLLISGIVTDVCVAFCALSAVEMGYDVFVVTDASGTFNPAVRDASWERMSAHGVQLLNWFAVACEFHRDWRNDIEGLAGLCGAYIPDYANLMTAAAARGNGKVK